MSEGHTNRRWRWTLPAVLAAGLFTTTMVLPSFQASNCGGNSAALTACAHYIAVLQVWQHDNPGKIFRFDTTSPGLRGELADLAGADWLWPARFLASTNVVRIDPSAPKQIVIVCDRAYDNVPRGVLWKAPMTHAVGYSTGETRLINPTEFSHLDLTSFVILAEQFPKTSD